MKAAPAAFRPNGTQASTTANPENLKSSLH
jgi:hypothetical protein